MKHANICEYKHFFEDKTNCYILLELCHNQSMNEMIKRRKFLTEEETRLLMIQMIDSVSWYFEKYGPSGVGLGFHLSEEVKVFVRKVNQYLHTTDEWDDDDGDWNYRSREEYLPIE